MSTTQAHKPTSAPLPIPFARDSQRESLWRPGKSDSTRAHRMMTQTPTAVKKTGPPSALFARMLHGSSSAPATTHVATHLLENDFISSTHSPQRNGNSVVYHEIPHESSHAQRHDAIHCCNNGAICAVEYAWAALKRAVNSELVERIGSSRAGCSPPPERL